MIKISMFVASFVFVSLLKVYPACGEDVVAFEMAYIQHLASLTEELGSGNSEIKFWQKLSGLSALNASVWSITDRTFGSAVAGNSCTSVVAPARLLSDGDGCNIWQIREESDHVGLRKRLAASMRTREADGGFTDYECHFDSALVDGAWQSSYWTVALSDGVISRRGRFPDKPKQPSLVEKRRAQENLSAQEKDPFPEGAFDADRPQLSWEDFDLICIARPLKPPVHDPTSVEYQTIRGGENESYRVLKQNFKVEEILHGNAAKEITLFYLGHTPTVSGDFIGGDVIQFDFSEAEIQVMQGTSSTERRTSQFLLYLERVDSNQNVFRFRYARLSTPQSQLLVDPPGIFPSDLKMERSKNPNTKK